MQPADEKRHMLGRMPFVEWKQLPNRSSGESNFIRSEPLNGSEDQLAQCVESSIQIPSDERPRSDFMNEETGSDVHGRTSGDLGERDLHPLGEEI